MTARKAGRMILPHYIQRTSVLAPSSGDSGEQGEPDRNNTINQTRLSLKSPFRLGRKFVSRGHRADVTAADEKEWLTPALAAASVGPAKQSETSHLTLVWCEAASDKQSGNAMWRCV